MTDDERAIRALVETWLAATKNGDVATVLSLMTDDAVFMVPGQEPFGRDAFATVSATMQDVRIEGESTIQELRILGDWAYLRQHLQITITPPTGASPARRSGYTLTIFRKEADGQWRLARDANLVVSEAQS